MSKSPRSPSGIDTFIGRKVRLWRLARGVSQERLAEMIGVTFQQVQKYEKGINRIAASRLFAVANVLGTPVEQFYPPFRAHPYRAPKP